MAPKTARSFSFWIEFSFSEIMIEFVIVLMMEIQNLKEYSF